MAVEWYKTAYRRNVVDMHITEDDPRFMTQFDPVVYAEMMELAKVDSAVVYAHSHVGNCFYPTNAGHMHKNLKGRDIFGETIEACRQKGIKVVAYYSLTHETWAYRNHSDWRIITSEGVGVGDKWRYGLCCPNSPYRDYVVAQVEELCNWYDFEGVRFDMTFWPWPCYCSYCRKRFAEEVGGRIPRRVDWDNPKWVAFQRQREKWMVEFAALATNTVKRLKPEASVEHQCSTYVTSWAEAVVVDMAKHNDFLQGDFYGGVVQGSFVCKLLQNLTPNLPFGFETSICLNLLQHTAIKSKETLQAKNYQAIANGGAFIFIDSIDPVGTLDRQKYEIMGEIFGQSKAYDQYLGGDACTDVAIYLSTESKFDPDDKRKKPNDYPMFMMTPHVEACVGAAQTCLENNIPYTVVTRKNLAQLDRYKVLVLPNILMMSRKEAAAIRKYVKNGGCVYASKYTSLRTPDGTKLKNFMLSDLFGASYVSPTKENTTYIAPMTQSGKYFERYSEACPFAILDHQAIVKAKKDSKVMARLTLPYTDPKDWRRFASIHHDPPGDITDHPAVVFNKVGKGSVVYVAGDLEKYRNHEKIFVNLIDMLVKKRYCFESDAPRPVEITMFHQPDKKRFIINVLNFQEQMPNIPVHNINIQIPLKRRKPKALLSLPKETPLKYKIKDGCVEFKIPSLKTFKMLALEYK